MDLPESLSSLFDEAERGAPHSTFLRSRSLEGEDFTFEEFAREARSVGKALVAIGVRPGDAVAVWSENRPRWCVAYAAIWYAGGVVVPMDAEGGEAGVRRVLTHASAKAVFVSEECLEKITGELLVPTLGIDECGKYPRSVQEALGADSSLVQSEGGESPAAIIYTSGTTGEPKGVVLTHRNIRAEIEGIANAVRFRRSDVMMMFLPMHHVLGQLGSLIVPAAFQCTVVHCKVRGAEDLLHTMREEGVSVLLTVPLVLHLAHEKIDGTISNLWLPLRVLLRGLMALNGGARRLGLNFGRLFFSSVHQRFGRSLRLIVAGGSSLDREVHREFQQLGFTITQAYGLTESTGPATFTPLKNIRFGSVGLPLTGVEVRILEPNEEGIGEVLLRGAIVTPGYLNSPEATAELLRNGWMHTGDLGKLERNGNLFITGRSKDVIVLGSGKNVYPEELENHYARTPLIREVCIVGKRKENGPDRSEKLHAVIVPDWDEIREQGISRVRPRIQFELEGTSRGLPAWTRVLSFEVRKDPLPRTATRKIKRFEVLADILEAEKEGAGEGEGSGGSGSLESSFGGRLESLIRKRAGDKVRVRENSSFELDLGLDSLNRVELLHEVERDFSISIGEEEAGELLTVGDLLGYVEEHSSGGGAAGEMQDTTWEEIVRSASDEDLPKPYLGTSFPHRFLRFVLGGMLDLVGTVWIRVRSNGLENVPGEGACLICSNHVSFLDGPVFVKAVRAKRKRSFAALGLAKYFSGGFKGAVADAFQVVPTDPERNIRSTIQRAAAVLKRGNALYIAPEGGRSADGRLGKLRPGAAILSVELGIPIVPAVIEGTYELWPRQARVPRAGVVEITFGKAFSPEDVVGDLRGEDAHRALTEYLRKRLVELGAPERSDKLAS